MNHTKEVESVILPVHWIVTLISSLKAIGRSNSIRATWRGGITFISVDSINRSVVSLNVEWARDSQLISPSYFWKTFYI